jgi:hypothetical protein
MTRTRIFWLSAVTLTAVAFAVQAQDIQTPAPAVAPGASSGSAAIERVDRNRDGKITKAEAKSDNELARQFGALDTNNSGELDSAEFARFEIDSEPAPAGGY